MHEVSGPVVAVGVVLAAVFVPCAFFTGIVGQFFRQFALTIAISTLISTFNSLTLSPALACLLLQPKGAKPDWVTRGMNFALGWFFRLFNRGFDLGGRGYVWGVGKLIRVPALLAIVYVGLLVLTYFGYLKLPTGFIPQQDKGYMIASLILPDAASTQRTNEIIDDVARIALDTPGVHHVNSVAGNSFVLSAYGSNFGSMFIILDGFDKRTTPELYSDAIAAKLRAKIGKAIPGAQVAIFGAPAVSGLGRAGGFKLMVEDIGDVGPRTLAGQTERVVAEGNKQPGLVGLFTVYRVNAPQLFVKVDPAACAAQKVDVRNVYATMQATLGSRYVNDFNLFGRTWQVNVQAEPKFRNDPKRIEQLQVKNLDGKLVPIGSVASVQEITGPLVQTRYNMRPAAAINGNVKPGVSSGEAIAIMNVLSERVLPTNMKTEWTELAFIEERTRDAGAGVFAIAVVVVFLCLAFLYESWALPFAVILVVPMCVSSALIGVYLAKQDVNVFTQVGFVVLIGLACKNAILIVEYAKRRRDAGADRREAVLDACRLRLRPILMTSVAFILGVVPLMLATGAGAEMRQALGVAVFAGMLGVTLFGVFLTPVFFVLVDWLTHSSAARSQVGRWVAASAYWLVSLGFARRAARGLVRRARRLAVPPTGSEPRR